MFCPWRLQSRTALGFCNPGFQDPGEKLWDLVEFYRNYLVGGVAQW